MYQWLISYARPIQYSFPFPLPQLELERWTLNCFQFNVIEDAAFSLLVQENIERKLFQRELERVWKDSFWLGRVLPVSRVSSLLLWWTRLSSFSKSSMEFANHSIFRALNTRRLFKNKAFSSYNILRLLLFHPDLHGPLTLLRDVISFFLFSYLRLMGLKSYHCLEEISGAASNNGLHNLKILPKVCSIDNGCVGWFKDQRWTYLANLKTPF